MAIGGERVMLVAVMRNEGPYILEWLAHHFALGIDELLVFTNHCTDNTDLILDRLEQMMPHRVKHQPNPKVMVPDRGAWHIMALRYAGHFGRYRAADWIYATDADELLILKDDLETLDDLYAATDGFDAISFTSVAFNSGGLRAPDPAPMRTRFTSTTLGATDGDGQTSGIKTLFRNKVAGARRPHRPVTPAFSETGMKWINGSGAVMPPAFTDGAEKRMPTQGTRTFAQYNHYIIKSAGEFLLKVDRGDAVVADRLGDSVTYWTHANRVGAVDTCGVEMTAAARDLYDSFLADPVLSELHAQSFAMREKRLAEIVETEQGAALARAIGYFEAGG